MYGPEAGLATNVSDYSSYTYYPNNPAYGDGVACNYSTEHLRATTCYAAPKPISAFPYYDKAGVSPYCHAPVPSYLLPQYSM